MIILRRDHQGRAIDGRGKRAAIEGQDRIQPIRYLFGVLRRGLSRLCTESSFMLSPVGGWKQQACVEASIVFWIERLGGSDTQILHRRQKRIAIGPGRGERQMVKPIRIGRRERQSDPTPRRMAKQICPLNRKGIQQADHFAGPLSHRYGAGRGRRRTPPRAALVVAYDRVPFGKPKDERLDADRS